MHSDLISQLLEYDGKGFNDIILSFGNGNVNVMFLTNHDMYMDITWLVINDSRISVSIPLAKVGDILQ
jgi:hypothetical protein